MTLEMTGDLLGLGSIVRLETESASGLFVVLARGAFRPDNTRNEVIARYLVGPHPYGEAPDRETFPIVATEIHTVVHHGYTDVADTEFLADLLDRMENGRRKTTQAKQFAGALTDIPDALSSGQESEKAARVRVDPFFELRGLVQQQDRKGES
ncbi:MULTISPECIES: DUF4176 domain-containing protein [unclassified Leifsonia]|uniref:DUF4176 domain-containing protein n=1 Tax=unclassified Leifsonia TaxID=2663824 RepID=UPI0010CF8FF4|nr:MULTISPECIES: DUF4176 domain-containing protein [unclassified Leifsonia]TDP98785.1 uncharacterized protein DUF4176 [Leifsonia sp. 115AMFTsu3.1]